MATRLRTVRILNCMLFGMGVELDFFDVVALFLVQENADGR